MRFRDSPTTVRREARSRASLPYAAQDAPILAILPEPIVGDAPNGSMYVGVTCNGGQELRPLDDEQLRVLDHRHCRGARYIEQ